MNKPDLLEIYRTQADKYDLLVSREDYQGNLLKLLATIAPLRDTRVVEFGAGTGRVTRLLTPIVGHIRAFDINTSMLEVARARLAQQGYSNWELAVGDIRNVAAPDGEADIAIAGWSVSSIAVYTGDAWRAELDKAIAEMKRVVKADGCIIIIETLGTGFREPTPPDSLKPYYGYLASRGFVQASTRTDYLFSDQAEAEDLTRFFFGDAPIAALTRTEAGVVLPECTGVWWARRGGLV